MSHSYRRAFIGDFAKSQKGHPNWPVVGAEGDSWFSCADVIEVLDDAKQSRLPDLPRPSTRPVRVSVPWLLTAALFLMAEAAGAAGAEGLKQVTLDLKSGTLTKDLPFDEPFILTGELPVDAVELRVRYLSHPRELRVEPNPDLCSGLDSDSTDCRDRRRQCELDPNRVQGDQSCYRCVEKRPRSKARDGSQLATWNEADSAGARFVASPLETCPTWVPEEVPLTWSHRDLRWADQTAQPSNRSFAITIPALEAERYYAFHVSLRTSSPEDPKIKAATAEMASRVAEKLLDAYARLGQVHQEDAYARCLGIVGETPDDCAALLSELCEAVTPAAKGALVAEPGSLCDPDGRLAIGSEVRPLILDLDQYRLEALDALQDRTAPSGRLRDLLGELHMQASAGHPLGRLFASLDTAAADAKADADQARILQLNAELAAVRRLVESDETERTSASLGFAADERRMTDDPTLLASKDTAAAMSQQYAATAKSLDRLGADLSDLVFGLRRLLADRLVSRPSVVALPASERLSAEDLVGAGSIEDAVQVVLEAREAAFAAGQASGRLADALDGLHRTAHGLASQIALAKADALFVVDGRAFSAFQTQQANYISADLGVVYAPDLDKVVPMLGANIYTRPVNKDVPLAIRGGFRRRFAFTFGITVKPISDAGSTPVTRDDLVGSNSLLLGGGYRLTDSARLSAGAVVFYERDPNPLKTDKSVSFSPFISLSFDWNVAGLFKGIWKSIGVPDA